MSELTKFFELTMVTGGMQVDSFCNCYYFDLESQTSSLTIYPDNKDKCREICCNDKPYNMMFHASYQIGDGEIRPCIETAEQGNDKAWSCPCCVIM